MNKIVDIEDNSIISLRNVKKIYGKTNVVDIEGLSVEKNSIYGLIGPNGAGKSTTMKMICGIINQTYGKIIVDGEELHEKNRLRILKKIGSLIESPSYYSNLSGYENMKIVKNYKGYTEEDINNALEVVGLQNHKSKKVKNYSFGMKQRLGIAMAILGFPKILILDEPTNGLDPQAMAEIRKLIISLPKKIDTTVMISSHSLDEIEKMANNIGIIGNGKMLYQGSINDFKSNYKGEIYIRTSDVEPSSILLEEFDPMCIEDELILPYMDDKHVGGIVKKLVNNGIDIYRLREEVKSLEDLFIDFTEKEHL